ncbi:MAG: ComEA family DNA-binding protein [Psychrobacter sp.]
MNAHRKFSFASLLTTIAFSLLLSVVTLSNANADPCFDDPKRAYEYLIAKEKAVMQAREQKVININRASEGELVSLDGIGSSKAQAIILYRDMFGDFKTVGELAKVKGIGAKTVEKNQRRLSVRD